MSLSFCWCGQVSSSLSQRLLFWYPNLNWKIRTRSRFKVDDHKYFILWGNQQLILQQEAWSCEKYLALGRFATSDKNPGNETHLEWGCFFFCLLLDLMIVSHNWFDFSTKKTGVCSHRYIVGLARFGKFCYRLKVPKSTMQINKTNHAKLAKKPEWHHSSTLLTKQFYQINYFPKWLFVSPLSFPWCSHAYKESECMCCWTEQGQIFVGLWMSDY